MRKFDFFPYCTRILESTCCLNSKPLDRSTIINNIDIVIFAWKPRTTGSAVSCMDREAVNRRPDIKWAAKAAFHFKVTYMCLAVSLSLTRSISRFAMSSTNAVATVFKNLHQPGNPVLLANIWDPLSAKTVATLPSCKVLGTSSFAVARANGTEDSDLTLETNLTALKAIAAVAKEYEKPLTVDIQDGYGPKLEDAIAGLIDLNVAGANLEDFDNNNKTMYSHSEAVERIKRATGVATKLGVPEFVLNARCDTLAHGGKLAFNMQVRETMTYAANHC